MHYAITDLAASEHRSPERAPQQRLLALEEDLRRWTACGTDLVQLREKALAAGEVFALARRGMEVLRPLAAAFGSRPRLLINNRPDVAAAAAADGVHLTSEAGNLTPTEVRAVYSRAGLGRCTVSVSCHTLGEVASRRDQGVDSILFGPVFGKSAAGKEVTPATGLALLAKACLVAGPVPVLALGGVTWADEAACRRAGAAGIAGIRLFAAP